MSDILDELGVKQRADLLTERSLTGPGHFAYLKISEGCDRTCSFCAIPAIRGKYISRPVGDLLHEAEQLASKGVRELILIAQDLSYYGLDSQGKQLLPRLVTQLSEIEGFDWIRLHYLYPANFPWELIPVIRDNPKICRYIDIPIQHISDRMLGLMRRSHDRKGTEMILNRIRKEIPDAAIRTTLIAGHPGETEREYLELRDFIQEFRFDRLGVFAYSHEEGTHSYNQFDDEITSDIKEERVAELMEIQQEISASLNQALIGRTMKVLVDRREAGFFTGRSEFDSPEVDQEILVPDTYNLSIGNFHEIIITESTDFDLYGIPS